MITITACLIVKNEENILVRCLDSFYDLVDEIVIVDTGSTDKTRALAETYTDKVYDFKWVDDFAAARNYSFSKATMDYIYVADADEVINDENRKKLKLLKENLDPSIEIVQMIYGNQLQFGTTYNYDEEHRPKLFKRIREFKWIDPIHETIMVEPVIFDSDIVILHMPVESHSKRDFEVFQKIIKKGERLSAKLVTMYAKELFISGNDQDFIDAYQAFLEMASDETRTLEELKDMQCVLARASRLQGDQYGFFTNCIKGVAEDACAEICYEIGEYYYEHKDYREATIWYYNAAYETKCRLNIHCAGDYPLRRLSDCYKMLGNQEQAEVYGILAKEWRV